MLQPDTLRPWRAPPVPASPTIAVTVSLAAWASQIDPHAITAPRRGEAVIAEARHLAIYLAHVTLGHDLTRLAAAFGRDRASLRHALRRIEDRRDDPAFDLFVQALEDILMPLRAGSDTAPERRP
ncbi:helix-turn-helix domain-containing protein [Phreatobacter sp.]|uniref:helix-turn-helix domain-containing protein n=1 Tax=Phreatobacter sp. TaxID=1966341 RepID=UPI003F6EAFF9